MQLNFLYFPEVHCGPVVVIRYVVELEGIADLLADASHEDFAAVVGESFLVVDGGGCQRLPFDCLDWVLADDFCAWRQQEEVLVAPAFVVDDIEEAIDQLEDIRKSAVLNNR